MTEFKSEISNRMDHQPFFGLSMDKIYIRQLKLKAVIGVYPRERQARQTLVVDLALHTDLRAAARSDNLKDTLDYAALVKLIRQAATKSRFRLIETLAGHIARLCLRTPRIAAVDVTVAKPGALPGVGVAVSVHRVRG